MTMIANERELRVTLERIARLRAQLAHLRRVESNAANYHAAASAFIAEIDRMQLVATIGVPHPAEFQTH